MNLQEQINRIHQMMGINESQERDVILDKILMKPKSEESFLEKKYLDIRKNDKEKNDFLNKVKETKSIINNFWDFDPTTDEDLESLRHNTGLKLTDLEKLKYGIVYDNFHIVYIDDFIEDMNINPDEIYFKDGGEKSYDDLNPKIKDKWKEFIDAYRFFPI